MSNNKDQKERIDYWRNEYWSELQKATFDSEEKQEKYVFAISTGAVGIMLGTMGFQKESPSLCYAIVALCLFAIAMFLCIIYHIIAKRNHQKQFDLIEKYASGKINDDSLIRDEIKKSNKKLDCISIFSVLFIFAGVVSFVLYLTKNLL